MATLPRLRSLPVLGLVLVATFAVPQAAGRLGTEGGAASTPLFEDASEALGVAESGITIWGLAVGDWNGDGCDDFFESRDAPLLPHLYRNGCPGAFVDELWRLRNHDGERELDRKTGAFADYDGDGRQDLFIPTGGGNGKRIGFNDQLYHQLPDGTFEDVAPQEGMTDRDASGRFGMWFDYDLDADLDLFVGHKLHLSRRDLNRNLLWRNDGGHFTKVSAEAGVDSAESSFSGAATDFDADGDLDVFTVPGRRPSLYVNQGNGTFVVGRLGRFTEFGRPMSLASADYDNDGDLDLFIARAKSGRSQLLRNDGPNQWTDVTEEAGAGFNYGGSSVWLDVDNDGWLDLYASRPSGEGSQEPKHPNVLLLNQRDGTFTDVAAVAGVTGPTGIVAPRTSAAWGDFDRDGRVDLVTQTQRADEAVQLFLNRTAGGNWITLHLKDPGSANREAIGAKAWITTGQMTQYRELTSPIALWSQNPAYLMIGLGSSTTIDTLSIRWPDGSESTFNDVEVNRHYLATKGGGLEAAQLE